VAIDTSVVGSDGWYLEQCWMQLADQKRDCEGLHKRYRGNPPLPGMNPRQRQAVTWFLGKSRTNFERLIVNAVLDRLRIRGIRTVVDDDEGGDPKAFKVWDASRGKLWSREVTKMALTMRQGYVVVGTHPVTNKLLVTAEDPRHATAITDSADPLMVTAGLKMVWDKATKSDVAYLLMPGTVRRATRSREAGPIPGGAYSKFNMQSFDWAGEPEEIPGLGEEGGFDAVAPIVPFVNEDNMAEFEPHIELLDRINHQILQRMTIATIQAFKQRAMKNLPQRYPKGHPMEGQQIDYEEIFTADPGAIWNIPGATDIWESGQADMTGILMSIRDDVKDLAAVSGSPLYSINPDVAAQGSAEGAALQREGITAKVISRQDLWEINHKHVDSLIFRTTGDFKRADPDEIGIIWAPPDKPGWAEIGSAISQTKGTIPVYMQLTEIAQFDPAKADRAMTMLAEDAANAIKSAQAANAVVRDERAGGAELIGQKVPGQVGAPTVPGTAPPPVAPAAAPQKALPSRPAPRGAPGRPSGSPSSTTTPAAPSRAVGGA
jgi:hypothetical protein